RMRSRSPIRAMQVGPRQLARSGPAVFTRCSLPPPPAKAVNLAPPGELLPEYPRHARSDIYSVGAVAYALLTGRPPFDGTNSMDVMIAHIRDEVAPPSKHQADVPVQFTVVVDVIGRDDVGVAQSGDGPGLAAEALQGDGVAGAGGEHLDGHAAAHDQVLAKEDVRHATPP